MKNQTESLFGRIRMGYLLAESDKLTEWERFTRNGLGLHVECLDRDVLNCRIDQHARRLIIRKGPAEDVVAIGWQLSDESALQLALDRLSSKQINVESVDGDEAELRGVSRFWRVKGPKGLSTEFFVNAKLTDQALKMTASGFYTAECGMGHVAISTRNPQAMQAFWMDIFDARLSDHIEERIDGVNLDLTFLRLNPRHHSIATAATKGIRLNPLSKQIHHMNLQANSLDDVTQGYLRCRAMGYDIANAIGQHPNDKELSFYVVSPSGFEIEIGWNPLLVDEATWQPTVHRGISLWGHRPENLTLAYRLGRLKNGLSSLLKEEYVPEGVQR
jgi:2,3-dihydroxybiphenyl 1,2-dioxygenase